MRKALYLLVVFLCSCGPARIADCRVTSKAPDVVTATATITNLNIKRIVQAKVSFETNGNGKIGSLTDYTFDRIVPIGAHATTSTSEKIPPELRPTWEHLGHVMRCQPLRIVYDDGSAWDASTANN